MTDMQIPDFMPQLRKGAGDTAEDGGCLVQVAGFLADGVSWTDLAPCVHPLLREAAIRVNDTVNDEVRQSLLPLAARLVGTGDTNGAGDVRAGLGHWALRQVEFPSPYATHLFGDRSQWEACSPMDQVQRVLVSILCDLRDGMTFFGTVAAMRNGVRFLEGLIDEFDRLTGRTQSGIKVSDDDWKRVTDHMKASV